MSQLINGKMFDRSLGLGGSDATKIVAGEWKTLYEEKMGIKEPDDLSFILPPLGPFVPPLSYIEGELFCGVIGLLPY